MLAHWLSSQLSIRCEADALVRTRDTPAQQSLDARGRLGNLRKAFALAPGHSLVDAHVALVDDVMTTGATARAIAQALRQAGARRIDVYCLARTAKPGHV